MKKGIKETASSGSVGAHAVATAPSRLGSTKKRNFSSFLVNFYDGLGNKLRMFPVGSVYKLNKAAKKAKVVSSINETFNLDSVFSQLSSFENKFDGSENDTVTYGVEDDKGNLMKVTVLRSQEEDFEAYIASYLSELKNFKENGIDLKDVSLAELLYKLKDLFDIRDVEFPNIPEDIVYNADEASENVEDVVPEEGTGDEFDEEGLDDEEFGEFDDGDEFGDAGAGGEFDEELEDDEFEGDEFADDESVEDFEEFEDEDSTESLLSDIISMLKAQAEQEKARYEAEAEKARADQAHYAAMASEATLSNKEELIAMKAEKDRQKQEEKKAKEEADLATYRYKKSRGMLDDANPTFEGFADDSLLMQALLQEEETILDPNLLRRQEMIERKNLQTQMRQARTDEERRAIQRQLSLVARKFALKRQELAARTDQKAAQMEPEDTDQQQQQQQQQPQQPGANVRESYVVEEITEEQYNKLDEGAKRQFKRYGTKFVRKFRCYGGPKDGRMVTQMADCGIRKDPFKVRQGKKASRLKKGQRVRKTKLAKRKAPSQRLVRMNKILRGEKGTTNAV